jgi:hypothetical protein
MHDLGIIYEHEEWHEPLFSALHSRGVNFFKFDLKCASFFEEDQPQARLYYNMVSPSAYKRGNQHAIPFAFAFCRHLEAHGVKVLNGSRSMLIEMSKSAQVTLLKNLRIAHPKTFIFNHPASLRMRQIDIRFPVILKPEQGGSGARMYLANSWDELEEILISDPNIWWPDHLLLVQEKIDYDPDYGIVRLEYLGGEFLYAMRVVTHDTFNLCPSLTCNPVNGDGTCEIPVTRKPQFYPLETVDAKIIADGNRILHEAGHDSGSVEYALDRDGQVVIYDINANSNLREPIAKHFGIQPFEKIVDFLVKNLG